MIDLLTEQIAGLYDPKAREFYMADWIPLEDQRMVMAHELTHALQDQHFQIDAWVKAAQPNDDAEMAREAVLEGSAMAAMVDYLLQGTGRSVQDLPPIRPFRFCRRFVQDSEAARSASVLERFADLSLLGWVDLFGGDPENFAMEGSFSRFCKPASFDSANHAPGSLQIGESSCSSDDSCFRETSRAGLDENR